MEPFVHSTHCPFEQTGVLPPQFVVVVHNPVLPQVSMEVPEGVHVTCPGAHTPVHWLSTHVWLVQSEELVQPGWQVFDFGLQKVPASGQPVTEHPRMVPPPAPPPPSLTPELELELTPPPPAPPKPELELELELELPPAPPPPATPELEELEELEDAVGPPLEELPGEFELVLVPPAPPLPKPPKVGKPHDAETISSEATNATAAACEGRSMASSAF
jgi:hypothetical protein